VPSITILLLLVLLGNQTKVNSIVRLLIAVFDDLDFDGIFPFLRKGNNCCCLFMAIVKERYLFSNDFVVLDEDFVSIIRVSFPLYCQWMPISEALIELNSFRMESESIVLQRSVILFLQVGTNSQSAGKHFSFPFAYFHNNFFSEEETNSIVIRVPILDANNVPTLINIDHDGTASLSRFSQNTMHKHTFFYLGDSTLSSKQALPTQRFRISVDVDDAFFICPAILQLHVLIPIDRSVQFHQGQTHTGKMLMLLSLDVGL
jgi:hypothetical protein